jgi:demethylmenaquinone methyltransferase/2-methoxy-6-polyprenyl-1,4-benzoquinol methylase
VRRVKPRAGEAILDMAGGTGDIAFRMAAAGANITVSDINQDMLDVGMERAMQTAASTGWCGAMPERRETDISRQARSMPTPSPSASATSPDIDKALAEAHRVLRLAGAFSASSSRPPSGRAFESL